MEHFSRHSIGTFRVACVGASSVEQLFSALDIDGFVRYEIDSREIKCKLTLLKALTVGFDLDHEVGRLESWDAAADLLWQRLMDQGSNKAALIWHNVEQSLANDLQLFLDAVELLLGVAETVERQVPGNGCQAVVFRVFLVGSGANFPQLG